MVEYSCFCYTFHGETISHNMNFLACLCNPKSHMHFLCWLTFDHFPHSRLYKTESKITDWAEGRTPGQKEGSSIHFKCLKGRHIFKRGSLPNSLKEFSVCSKGHRLLAPAYDINHLTQDGKRIALDQCDGSRPVVDDDCQSPHGRDGPSNGFVNLDVIITPRPAQVFPTAGSINNQHTRSVEKDFDGNGYEAVSSKKQKLSNAYSRCSAHVVTDVFVEDNNLDSSTNGTGDARSLLGLVLDEGSVVEKCGSSDDILENTKWNFSVTVKSKVDDLRGSEYGSYNSLRNPTYGSAHHSADFRDKVNIKKKPMPRKNRYQSHPECTRENSKWPMKESNTRVEPDKKNFKADRKKKATKWKRLDDSFPASGPVNHVSASSDNYLELKSPSEGKELPAHLRNVSPRMHINDKTSGFKHNSSALPADFSTKAFHRNHSTCNDVQMQPQDSGSSNGTSKSLAGIKRKRNFAQDDKKEIKAQDSIPEQTALSEYKPFGRKLSSIDGTCREDRFPRPVVRGNSGIIYNGNVLGKSKPVKFASLTSVLKIAKRCTINQNAKENASSIGAENAGCFSLKVESHEVSLMRRGRDTGGVKVFGSKFKVKAKPRSKETRKRKLSEITGYSNDEKYTSCLPILGDTHFSNSKQAGRHTKLSLLRRARDDCVGKSSHDFIMRLVTITCRGFPDFSLELHGFEFFLSVSEIFPFVIIFLCCLILMMTLGDGLVTSLLTTKG